MNIYDLPIVTDENAKDKTTARIFENKIVCHPDLVEKVIEGMGLLRASAKGYEKDIEEMKNAKIAGKNDAC
jgi:hypothetical protein